MSSSTSIDSAANKASEKAKAVMMPPPEEELHDPSPDIPAVSAPSRPAQVVAPKKSATAASIALPAIPRNKKCRVIRVKTAEGVIAMINADDYDPELAGHEAITPDDEHWGKIAVDARQRAEYEAEKLAAIKRVVRGGTS